MVGTSPFFISALSLHCMHKFAGVNEPHTTTDTAYHNTQAHPLPCLRHYTTTCKSADEAPLTGIQIWPFLFHAIAHYSKQLYSGYSYHYIHTFSLTFMECFPLLGKSVRLRTFIRSRKCQEVVLSVSLSLAATTYPSLQASIPHSINK